MHVPVKICLSGYVRRGMPIIPVGERHDAVRKESQERIFRCPACAHRSIVRVRTEGRGSSVSLLWLDGGGAADRAGFDAWKDSAENADLFVRLCPCPRCGKRNSGALIGFFFLSALKMLLLAAPITVIMALLRGGWLYLFPAAVVVVYYFQSIHWKWTQARRRVVFVRTLPPKHADA